MENILKKFVVISAFTVAALLAFVEKWDEATFFLGFAIFMGLFLFNGEKGIHHYFENCTVFLPAEDPGKKDSQ